MPATSVVVDQPIKWQKRVCLFPSLSLSLVAKQNNQMHTNNLLPSLPAKSRTIAVRLISMAMTGYYKTLVRPRQHHPLSMLKYDPVGTSDYFSSFSCAGEAERKDCSPPPPRRKGGYARRGRRNNQWWWYLWEMRISYA